MNSKKGAEKESEVHIIDGMPVRTSLGEFAAEEMLECNSCHRRTPPNRFDCIYCGKKLEIDEKSKARFKPVIRPPADDTKSCHLIYFSGPNVLAQEQLDLLEQLTRLPVEDIRVLTGSGLAVPLARGEPGQVIEIAAEKLRETGLSAAVFLDSEVALDSQAFRLRGMSLDTGGQLAFILFNNDEVVRFSANEVELIVVGLSLENKTEAAEKHKGKGLEEVLHTTEISDDKTLIDVYLRSRPSAFRIQPTGFDFAFLGKSKGFTAAENLKLTIRSLRELAPDAIYDDSYISVRTALEKVWPSTEFQETKSVKQKGFGKFERTRVTVSSNLEQFSMYSNLQRTALHRSTEFRSCGDG